MNLQMYRSCLLIMIVGMVHQILGEIVNQTMPWLQDIYTRVSTIDVLPEVPFEYNSAYNKTHNNRLKIHVFILVNLQMIKESGYNRSIESWRQYCKFHKYHLNVLDPDAVMRQYGGKYLQTNHLKRRRFSDAMVTSRAMVLLYYFRSLSRKLPSHQNVWMIHIDVDIMVSQPYIGLHEIIQHSLNETTCNNHSIVGLNSSNISSHIVNIANKYPSHYPTCHLIFQISASTINGGFGMFPLTPTANDILSDWAAVSLANLQKGLEWQGDQGMLMMTYLLHLQNINIAHSPLPQHCIKLSNAQLKARCFVKDMKELHLYPPDRRLTLPYCISLGIHPLDLFNVHDWWGDEEVDDHGIFTRYLGNSKAEDLKEQCLLGRAPFYHGKEFKLYQQIKLMSELTEEDKKYHLTLREQMLHPQRTPACQRQWEDLVNSHSNFRQRRFLAKLDNYDQDFFLA